MAEHRLHRTPGGILHQDDSGNAKFPDGPAVQLPHDFGSGDLHPRSLISQNPFTAEAAENAEST
jgi:hypothetical protein